MFEEHLTSNNQFVFAMRINGEITARVYEFTDRGTLNMMLNACKDAALEKFNEDTKKT